jgi:hypothetical protein
VRFIRLEPRRPTRALFHFRGKGRGMSKDAILNRLARLAGEAENITAIFDGAAWWGDVWDVLPDNDDQSVNFTTSNGDFVSLAIESVKGWQTR